MTRLEFIASLASERTIADVGSDHGFLVKILFERGSIDYAYAMDISQKCVDKARHNLDAFSSKTTFLCGDGLEPLDSILQDNLAQKQHNIVPKQVFIAGMGGKEIKNILSQDAAQKIDKYVLSPQRDVVELRRFLLDNNFTILVDKVVKEGKMFYNVISVQRNAGSHNSKQTLTENELLFGLTNIREMHSDFTQYAKFQLSMWEDILAKKEVPDIRAKYNLLRSVFSGKL